MYIYTHKHAHKDSNEKIVIIIVISVLLTQMLFCWTPIVYLCNHYTTACTIIAVYPYFCIWKGIYCEKQHNACCCYILHE